MQAKIHIYNSDTSVPQFTSALAKSAKGYIRLSELDVWLAKTAWDFFLNVVQLNMMT